MIPSDERVDRRIFFPSQSEGEGAGPLLLVQKISAAKREIVYLDHMEQPSAWMYFPSLARANMLALLPVYRQADVMLVVA